MSFNNRWRAAAALSALLSVVASGSFVALTNRAEARATVAPPTIQASSAVTVLGSKNHNLVNIGLDATIADEDLENVHVRLFVFSDEDDTHGDSAFAPDATASSFQFGPVDILSTLALRAERDGDSDGRVYVVLVAVADTEGNLSYDIVTVVVPLNNSQKAMDAVLAQAAAAEAQANDFFFAILGAGAVPDGYHFIGDSAPIGPKQ